MKPENVSEFRAEAGEVASRFAAYPYQYLEWMGYQSYEAAREALAKRHISKRVLDLIDGALMLLIAAEQTRAHRLEPIQGLIVAETLPVLIGEIVAESGGWDCR